MLLTPERTFLVSRSLKGLINFARHRSSLRSRASFQSRRDGETAFGCHRPKTDIVRVNVTKARCHFALHAETIGDVLRIVRVSGCRDCG